MDLNSTKLKEIADYIQNNGGKVYTTPYYLNLFGIRDINKVNTFNDMFVSFWYTENGTMECYTSKSGFTTDPGITYLKNPLDKKGCAIVKEGWHENLWKFGYHHQNKSNPALVQSGSVTVHRDNTRDGNLHLNTPTFTGHFGINFHRSNSKGTSVAVNDWSAGCQVWANPQELDGFLSLVHKAESLGQKTFSYFLVNNSYFNIENIKNSLSPRIITPEDGSISADGSQFGMASADMSTFGMYFNQNNGTNIKAKSIKEMGFGSNTVKELSNVKRIRNKNNESKISDNRKKSFEELQTNLIKNSPDMDREIIKSPEMYDANILKGDQVAKGKIITFNDVKTETTETKTTEATEAKTTE